jgi:hypothetical protein
MGELKISSVSISNMSDNVDDVEIETRATDGVQDQEETTYINPNWNIQLGIYKTIPEFKIALDMRSIWTIGEKIDADPETLVILDHVSGWGKDTFRNILKNGIVTKRLGEDFYAEIMRADDGTLLNLKVLDPGSIRQVYNRKGILLRYEQINKLKKGETLHIFKPEDIFHLTNKRIADEIHGTADSDALKSILDANNESFVDVRKLMHRYVKPMMKFILDTDDPVKIEELVTKFDAAVNKGENLYIPKGSVEQELIAVPSNSTLNPLPWREHLKNYFFQVVGIPQIILGSSGEFTESTAKIAYLAFEQSVKDEQTDIIEQVWDQLGLRIKLSFPASLRNELLSDESKDGTMGFQPNDTTAGIGK